MNTSPVSVLRSSIIRKQIVAVTGIAMVLFLCVHLAGNLLILIGPEAFNDYSAKLAAVPELLWVARAGLIAAFIFHVYFTVVLTIENRNARGDRYAVVQAKGDAVFARRFMLATGVLVFFVLFLHLRDFTFTEKEGPASVVAASGENLGLYGLVWNSFLNVPRSILYIAFVCSVGIHLTHGVQSLFQTLGMNNDRWTPLIQRLSIGMGIVIAAGFSLIPLYVLIKQTPAL